MVETNEDRTSAAVQLDAYLHDSEVRQGKLRATKATDPRLRRILKNVVPVGLRGTARMVITDLSAPLARRRVPSLLALHPLLLHLGSGGEHKDGWVNVDLAGDPVELAWNLARPLPFPAGTVDAVFHEHLLEHIPLAAGAALMRECRRVLKPGGVLRIGVPDAGRLVRSYADDDGYLESLHPGRPTSLLAVQELFYWHRHRTMYDFETLDFLVRTARFERVQERQFGDSALDPAPDTERRRAETLYVETVR